MTVKELRKMLEPDENRIWGKDDDEVLLYVGNRLYPLKSLSRNPLVEGSVVIRAKEADSDERASALDDFALDKIVIDEIEFQAIDTLGVDRADFEKVKEELYDKYLLCRDGEWDYIDTERFITDLSDFFREKQIDMVNFDEVEADMIEKAKAGEVTRLPRPKNLGDETGTFMMMSGQRNS